MVFKFSYTQSGYIVSSKMVVNGKIIDEQGNEIKTEEENEDVSNVVLQLLSQILGKSFLEIEPTEKAYRFLIKESLSTGENESGGIDPIAPTNKFDFSNLFNREDLKTQYSKNDLVELFDLMIKYAQRNSINIFFQPICFKDSLNIFMVNLVYLKDTISQHNDLKELINSKIPMNAFGAIGRAYENQIDKDTNIRMLQMINLIKPILQNGANKNIPTNKKWWEFWK